jgi:hypothetical protein
MARKIFIRISPGGWEVKLEGMPEYLSRHPTQTEAMEAARRYAAFYQAEIRILQAEEEVPKPGRKAPP